MQNRMLIKSVFGAIAVVGATIAMSAAAGAQIFITPAGANPGGGVVDAEATFVAGAGSLSITLKNLLVNQTDVAQAISDLGFTLSSGQTLADASIASSSGLLRTVNGDKTYTDGGMQATGWQLDSLGSPIRLHVLGTPVGPAHMIIGAPDSASNKYLASNGSMKGNGPHNPFLAGPVTFTLNIAGLTSNDKVTNAIFSFNSTEGSNVTGQPGGPPTGGQVPEPGAMAMLAGLSIPVLAFVRRIRK